MVKPPRKSAALRLRAQAGVERLILMTDEVRLPEPHLAIKQLPAGSIVIFRDYDHPEREALARSLRFVAQQSGCWFLVAADVALARRTGADGVHLPEYLLYQCPINRHGFTLVTAACHSRGAIWRARQMRIDLALVSPVFDTGSHPGARSLGVHRLSRLIDGSGQSVAALGGVSKNTAASLRDLSLAGVAGISGIVG